MKVLHVLAELNHSGAERMMACSHAHWRSAGIEPVIVGMAEGSHPFASTLADAGYEVILRPGVRSARGVAALRQTIADTRPRLVHIHGESCFDIVALVAALSCSVDGVVRTVHNNFRFSGSLRVRRAARAAFARALGVVWVACSAEVAQTEHTYSRNSARVIENWIDVDAIARGSHRRAGQRLRRNLGIAPDAKVLALIGNCGAAKNHELIPAVLHALERPIHILHVGRAQHQSREEAEAWQGLPERHKVHHLGARDDVPALLAASDLLVFPSLYEGMPLVPAEALCAGVPVLAADSVGLQWLAEMPLSRLAPPDPRVWSDAIAAEVTNERSAAASDAAVGAARDRFGVERGVNQYVEAYSAALQTPLPLRRRRPSRARTGGIGK